MIVRWFLLATAVSFMVRPNSPDAMARHLTLQDRIYAQEAIERVYWKHRIWPPENGSPKPSLEEVLTRSQIGDRVVDYPRKSNALAEIWNRPISAEDLQDEMRRMAAESKAPDVLRELFAALGDDPFRIAETLVRQTLADRLIREAYANDDRLGNESLHGPLRAFGTERRPDKPEGADSQRMSFDAWWASAGASANEELDPVSESIEAVEIESDQSCVNDTWKTIPAGAPLFGQAVWTGTEMIVWGVDGSGLPVHGARYNPATDSWSGMSNVNAPPVGTVVWTGREMIVWNGFQVDGGRYDPTTDTWGPISLAGAPAKRERYTAIWTGSEMIVWGGRNGPLTFKDGARYNPSTDTWAAVTTSGAPQDRALHVAVWTGTEMIVWGGESATGISPPPVGGRYNPSSDTWLPISKIGQPPSREGATGVWTGSEMIVWGGGFLYFPTGGRYDPSLDTWTETSLVGAPEGRGGHSAVWTGHEMIIWGGSKGGAPFSGDGGRYNPSSNKWVPVTMVGAPIALANSAVVWTGSEMLVWAAFGFSSNGYSGRYCASVCDVETTFYRDSDADGYGSSADSVKSCAQPPGYVDNAGDCNDRDSRIHPGADEICNGEDDDCNGLVDDALPPGTLEVHPDKTVLWPANHAMVPIHFDVTLGGACPTACPAPPAVLLASVTSSEPDNASGGGDGNTTNDIQGATVGTADFDIQLRAERDNQGVGRAYDIVYTATNCFGVSISGHASVLVQHDQQGATAARRR